MLLDCGVDYLGFPLAIPVHEEDIDEAGVADIIANVGRARAVVITYLNRSAAILSLLGRVGADIVQLHGPVPLGELEQLRDAAPGITVIKSVVVRPDEPVDLETALVAQHLVDAYITDTFDPMTGASGATGRTHDWPQSRRIVEATDRPVILAGGLHPGNVANAIQTVDPSAVDVHTGVEAPSGRKSKSLVKQFVAAARRAFRSA
jgi:phosphoribosylanthranilate isomerase